MAATKLSHVGTMLLDRPKKPYQRLATLYDDIGGLLEADQPIEVTSRLYAVKFGPKPHRIQSLSVLQWRSPN